MTSINPANFNVSHIMDSVRGTINTNLPESSSNAYILLESSALISTTMTVFKNYSYVSMGNKLGINDICHFFSSRVAYLETALVALACAVYNAAFVVLYAGLTLVTFGLMEQMQFSCKKHWRHTAYALASLGIALLGMAHLASAQDAYFSYMKSCFESLKEDFSRDRKKFEKPLIGNIQKIYKKHHAQFEGFLFVELGRLIDRKLIENIGKNINDAKELDGLWNSLKATYTSFEEARDSAKTLFCNECKKEIVCEKIEEIPVDVLPIMNSIMKVVDEDLPRFSRDSFIMLDSSAFCSTLIATLKNVPFVALANELGVNDLCHYLSSRATYLEAACIALASTIHSVAMALIYSSLCILTLGLSDNINFACKKHLYHISYGLTSLGISLLGTLVPTLGVGAHIAFLKSCILKLKEDLQEEKQNCDKQLTGRLQKLYQHYQTQLDQILAHKIPFFNFERYVKELRPIKVKLDKDVGNVSNLDELWESFKNFYNDFKVEPKETLSCDECTFHVEENAS